MGEFIAAIMAHKPDLMVDVRYRPFSRRIEFNKNNLARHLGLAGLDYEHWPGLGTVQYQSKDKIQIAVPAEVDRLHKLAEGKRIVVVCACATTSPARV